MPLGTKQINLLGKKLLQISARSLKGEELQLRLPPRESARPGETGGNRANPSPTRPPDLCAIPVISLAAVPQQQRDREIIGADHSPWSVPGGSTMHCSGRWI